MSYREFLVSSSPVFSGYQRAFDESNYAILGVPLDVTSTYRTGARFAPLAIREASLNIETYSFRSGIDVEVLKIHDLGDLHVSGEVEETIRRLEMVAGELLATRKIPVFIGGEHTITLGVMRAIGESAAIISFDAHLDLRNEYMGLTTSHTTFMRRIHEQVRPIQIIEIGTRAVCTEELEYAEKSGIHFIANHQLLNDGVEKTLRTIRKLLADCKQIHVTADMDVLDPAFAPGVQNPEPDGLTMSTFLNLLCGLCDQRVVALDLVEAAPNYDNGTTAICAAKTLFEALCRIEKMKSK